VRKLMDIAMATVHRPRLLLLDEPTSGVSVEQKFAIMDVIMAALRAENITVLFVEHDMDIIARYATRVLAFYDGTIIADGPPHDVIDDPQVRRYIIGEQLRLKVEA
jgi:branched-chain amino acid transport system ATP-binding protein